MTINGNTNDDIFQGRGVEVYLDSEDDFLKIRETLTRVGIPEDNRLSQVCYILHKRGRYIIAHYKELMCLDGVDVHIDMTDIGLRNTIAGLLEDWGLLEVHDPARIDEPQAVEGSFRVLAFKEKKKWRLISPYRIGIDKRPSQVRAANEKQQPNP